MFRHSASRLALKSITSPIARPTSISSHTTALRQRTSSYASIGTKRPQLPQLSRISHVQSAVLRRSVSKKQHEAEDKYAHQKIKAHPESVTASSTTSAAMSDSATATAEHDDHDVDVFKGVKDDLVIIRETFSLAEVPKPAYYMGLAGTLPYLATSLSTLFCSWELNHAVAGQGWLLSESLATHYLHLLEPLQIGYGASILSFLGAIHWGLEWAGFGGYQGYKRYAIGVVAPAVAWSTLLMPIEGALITQFTGFISLYYIDARATRRGWTPAWYDVYRFVLTAIVGGSIVLTLVSRGELPNHIPTSVNRAKVFHDTGSAEAALAEEEHALAKQREQEAGDGEKDEE